MRVTYYALKPLQVGSDLRQPGDLVPEANNWPYLSGYVDEGRIASVLVATLPEDAQMMLLEWEADQVVTDTVAETEEVTVPVPKSATKAKEKTA